LEKSTFGTPANIFKVANAYLQVENIRLTLTNMDKKSNLQKLSLSLYDNKQTT